VALEMIDGDERDFARAGDGLGGGDADHHAPDQTGPAGRGDGGERTPTDPRPFQGARDQPVDVVEMGARRYFRHDAAERPMLGFLGQDFVGQHAAPGVLGVADHRRRRFVATGFDAENYHVETTGIFAFQPLPGYYAIISSINLV